MQRAIEAKKLEVRFPEQTLANGEKVKPIARAVALKVSSKITAEDLQTENGDRELVRLYRYHIETPLEFNRLRVNSQVGRMRAGGESFGDFEDVG